MRLLKLLAPAAVAASLVLAGCGSGSSGSGAVSGKAQTALQPFLEAVRQAAASGNRDAVVQAVGQLKHEVQLERSGISASRQAAIDNAADAVLNDIHSQPSSTSATPTHTETTPPPPSTPPATVTITPPATVTVSPPVTSLSPSDTSSSSGEGDGGDG
jgi:hypothetical protein